MGSVLKRNSVEYATEDSPEPRREGARCRAKSAELVRIDGVPVAIEFTCSCGERSLIELDLDDAAKTTTPS
ncbi:MAG: hypothetical protein R3F34_16145 [Planctomycetota bacterium]